MNRQTNTLQPCWSTPHFPPMSWSELVQPALSEWASYFPDIAPADPKVLRFVRDTEQDIEGIYRHRRLNLNVIHGYTVISLSANQPPTNPLSKDEAKLRHLIHFLTTGTGLLLRGEIEIELNGQMISYKQEGLETEAGYLKCLFDLLSDLADAYPTLIAIGGELIPALLAEAVKKNWGLRSLNTGLLQTIAQATTTSFQHQVTRLLCPTCLVRCSALQVELPWLADGYIIYYGCRACGQSKQFMKIGSQVIAILDNRITMPYSWDNRIFRSYWLAHRRLCDFDKVEIVQATDEEVERFVVQLGNDTDSIRTARYKQIPCSISAGCDLSDNTLRILKWLFRQIDITKS